MSPEIESRAKSYKDTSGKWVPSGVVTVKDVNSKLEFTETFNATKKTKEEADSYFNKKIKGLN